MRIPHVLFSGFLVLALFPSLASGEPVRVVRGGAIVRSADTYRIGDDWYFSVKDVARIYGGGLYWHSVRGKIRLRIRGVQAVFETNSPKVRVGEKDAELPRAAIVRAGRAFIPVEFLSLPEFVELVGEDSQFDPAAGLLRVDPRANVGPLRWAAHNGGTRIAVDLREGVAYVSDRRGRGILEIRFSHGVAASLQPADVRDDAVEKLEWTQDKHGCALRVQMREGVLSWKISELPSPRRLVIDVSRPKFAPADNSDRVRREAPEPPKREVPSGASEVSGSTSAASSLHKSSPGAAIPIPDVVPHSRRRIAIDAGHGGKDSGATGARGIVEKNINLLAAKELARLLEKDGTFEVLLTRDKDVFIPLWERSRRSNEFGADLFISLHCNGHSRKSETGYEIYFLSERASDPEAQRLAEVENSVLSLEKKDGVEDEAANLLYALARTEFINDSAQLSGLIDKALEPRVDLANRGVSQAQFIVLRGANSPAALVEMAFVSHRGDADKLQSSRYRKKIVEGVADGILEFAKRKGWPRAKKK